MRLAVFDYESRAKKNLDRFLAQGLGSQSQFESEERVGSPFPGGAYARQASHVLVPAFSNSSGLGSRSSAAFLGT